MNPTVIAVNPFNAESDSQYLRKAMKGIGTDEKAIISVLSKRSRSQRIQICQTYKAAYGKDLISDLKGELGGKFETLVVALMQSEADYDAEELHRAIAGLGTDEECLIEILCSRSAAQIKACNESYKKLFKKALESDLSGDTSGSFRNFLVSLAVGNRQENAGVDEDKARQDAKTLYDAGEARWGTDMAEFNRIFVLQSFGQLQVMFEAYASLGGKPIEKAIEKEMSGDVKKGFLTLVKVVKDPSAFFAEQLYRSMKGFGTTDSTLIRVVATRCEFDMVQIKQVFHQAYGKSLSSFIEGDTSGDYRRLLLALIGA